MSIYYPLHSNFLRYRQPEVTKSFGFQPKGGPAIVLPDVETVSEAGDSELDSDPEPSRTTDPQAMTVRYTQPQTKAVETGQASNKQCPSLTKPSTGLPTLAATRALYLPIDWLDHFLTNTDIPSDVHPKHQQCGVWQDAPKVYLCPWGCPTTVYSQRVLPKDVTQPLLMPIATTLSWESGTLGKARTAMISGSISLVAKATPCT